MTNKLSLKVLNDAACKHGLIREKTCDQAEPLLLGAGLKNYNLVVIAL
jgi:hypothetical protein